MKSLIWTAIIAVSLFAGASNAIAEENSPAWRSTQQSPPQGTSEGTQEAGGNSNSRSASPALTIYNQNFALVKERLPLELTAGVNTMRFSEITSQLEPSSVVLRDPLGQRSLQVLEQNYRADPISQELLLSLYEGKTIDFLVNPGEPQKMVKGKIIRSGYIPSLVRLGQYQQPQYQQPIIEVDGVLRFGLPGQPLFPALTGDTILKPTLNWQLRTDKPGRFDAELSYITGGMSWQADYNLVAPEKGNTLDVIGWVTIDNRSGRVFENARLKLMAGDVNKLQPGERDNYARTAKAMAVLSDERREAVTEKTFDEYHLYTLERPTTLHDQEVKQVEFVRAAGVSSNRLYLYDGASFDWARFQYYSPEQLRVERDLGTQTNKKVWVVQEFKNSEKNHLGMPLPKGRLRFYRRDNDGHLEFTGESEIDHTPKDETVRVYTGNAFDLVGERKRTNYAIDTNRRWIDESFEIRLRNHKKEAATFTVQEHLYRCVNWQITEESHPHKKTEAQRMEFQVTVPPDGEQVVTYTVHYTW
ncbi:MAG TPA: DUF4139 domain-containing protein [Terriglobales bacterium]|nr:DUF4139 domain-containing protein [Terriglobales bacterium]